MICLLHNYFETNLIIPWKSNKRLGLIDFKWQKINQNQDYESNSDWKTTSEPSYRVLCLKLKQPQHQRHLLLKGWTNVYFSQFLWNVENTSSIHSCWTGLSVLISWLIQNDYHDFDFSGLRPFILEEKRWDVSPNIFVI